MKSRLFLLFGIFLLLTGCVPPPILCFLDFSDYSKTYEFDCSKEELKNRIFAAYWYDSNSFSRIFGKTNIENEDANKKYRQQYIYLNIKDHWHKVESEVRANTGDTLNLLIGKYASPRDDIRFQVILKGDENKSSLTVNGFKYQQMRKCCEKKDYRKKLSRKIKRKFINKLD